MSNHEFSMRLSRRRRAGQLACLALAAAMLVILVSNLSWFDEPLLPQIEALRQPRQGSLEGNGYPLALGFLAAEPRDPRAAGAEIIARLHDRRDRGEPMALDKEQIQAVLGTPLADAGLEASLRFHCQARHRLDCPGLLRAWMTAAELDSPQIAVLFNRYEMLLQQSHFVETPEPSLEAPWPPFGPIVALGRLRLAMSLRDDTTPVFLEKVSQELAFWRMTLREGERLGTKMVALAAIRNAHDLVAALMRERDLDAQDLEILRHVIRPFVHEERDIGAAFVAEVRGPLLSGVTPFAHDASWMTGLLLQENATFNQFYRETIEPMRRRTSLAARQYFENKAYEPLSHELRWAPAMFYNFGGKLALSRSTWDPHQFPSRVHDEDGRIALLLIQAQIEEHPEMDVERLVRSSQHRNPYTGGAMDYDEEAGTIGFVCLHTAFHPPELADQCAVALGRGTTAPATAGLEPRPISLYERQAASTTTPLPSPSAKSSRDPH
jgi:hypothetical protein